MRVSSCVLTMAVAGCALFSSAISCRKANPKATSETATTRGASLAATESGQVEGVPSLAQGCDTTPGITCYRDTARAGFTDEVPDLYPLASWIWFAAAGDSIEISARPTAFIATSLGQERDALQNTAPQFRHRLQNDGVVIIWLSFDQQQADTVPYTLRVWHHGSTSSPLRSTGKAATLTVVSRHKGETFSLVPASIAPTVRDRSQWPIIARTYHVALVSDSLYELCRLPCTAPDTVKLTASVNVVKKF
jgi:hypothetical protein